MISSACTIFPGLYTQVDKTPESNDYSIVLSQDGQTEVRKNPGPPPYTFIALTPEVLRAEALRAQQAASSAAASPPGLPTVSGGATGYRYLVGPGDVLSIVVWNQPDISNPAGQFGSVMGPLSIASASHFSAAAGGSGGGLAGVVDPGSASGGGGHVVGPDGKIFFPYAGEVEVQGCTVDEVRRKITKALDRVIKEPQVEVSVAQYRSKLVYITGEVKSPSAIALSDRPIGVLDAINAVGGLTSMANVHKATLTRAGVTYSLDLSSLYNLGLPDHNVLLQANDVINVADNSYDRIFVLGEVKNETPIPIQKNYITLTEALATAGGLDRLTSDVHSIFVFRAPPASAPGEAEEVPTVYGLDMSKADGMLLAGQFELKPRDVVYVAATPFSHYSSIITQLTPTVSTIYYLATIHAITAR